MCVCFDQCDIYTAALLIQTSSDSVTFTQAKVEEAHDALMEVTRCNTQRVLSMTTLLEEKKKTGAENQGQGEENGNFFALNSS